MKNNDQVAEIYRFIKQNTAPDDHLLTVKEVATKLGVTIDTVWRHKRANRIPQPVKINTSTRWRQSDINQYIQDLPSANVEEAYDDLNSSK